MIKVTHLFPLVIVFWSLAVSAQNGEMQEAIAQYNDGFYDAAIEKYQRVLEQGLHSAELYYNLGNCYYRKNDLGNAIYNYESALLLQPNDKDIQHNLRIAESQIENPIEKINEFFLIQWKENAQALLGPWSWAFIGLLLLWIGTAGMILWLTSNKRRQKIIGFTGGLVLLFLSLLPFYLAANRIYYRSNTNKAIVITTKLPLKSAPDEASETLQTLSAGYKVKMRDRIGDWHKIRLSDGNEGWVPGETIMEIKLGENL